MDIKFWTWVFVSVMVLVTTILSFLADSNPNNADQRGWGVTALAWSVLWGFVAWALWRQT
jgi:hypothetical protein